MLRCKRKLFFLSLAPNDRNMGGISAYIYVLCVVVFLSLC